MKALLNKVKNGIHACWGESSNRCFEGGCPYFLESRCIKALRDDIRRLVDAVDAAQKPRLLTLDEITKHDGPVYVTWQDPESGCWAVCPPKEDIYRYPDWDTLNFPGGPVNQLKMKYGKTWRCWTQQPTKEQREAVLWDE